MQLIDAREDRHLWSETFDGNFSELFDVQTRVATNIAGYLEANLTQQEQARIARKPTQNMRAYALGRRSEYNDMTAIRKIGDATERDDYRMSSFVLGVVNSDAFRMRKAETMTESSNGGQ